MLPIDQQYLLHKNQILCPYSVAISFSTSLYNWYSPGLVMVHIIAGYKHP